MKRLLSLMLAAALVFSLASCGNASEGGNSAPPEQTQGQDAAEPTPEPTQEPTPEPTQEPTPEPTPEPAKELAIGEMYATDDCEITFNSVTISSECSVPTGSHSSRVKEASEGNTLIIIDAAVKNIATEELDTWDSGDKMYTAYAMYNDKYKYEAESFFVGEDSIAPLAEKTQCLPIEIPTEVENAEESLVVYITVGGETYQYAVR